MSEARSVYRQNREEERKCVLFYFLTFCIYLSAGQRDMRGEMKREGDSVE